MPIEKRKVAVVTLSREHPKIAWKLLLSLLPDQHQVSMGTHKPLWQSTIPKGWKESVTQEEYEEQVLFYADLAISEATDNTAKLAEIIGRLGSLPNQSRHQLLEVLSSQDKIKLPEEERLTLWNELVKFTSLHRRFSDAKWAINPGVLQRIEKVSNDLAPTNPSNLYRHLFTEREVELYERNGDWQEQRNKLNVRRQGAVQEILKQDGINSIIEVSEFVQSPFQVGWFVGEIADSTLDDTLLPAFINSEEPHLLNFMNGYVRSRYNTIGWDWVDAFDIPIWSVDQSVQFFGFLPFISQTWKRVADHLGDSEGKYWRQVNVNPYEAGNEINIAVDKLLKYDRPNSAIDCIHAEILDEKTPDVDMSVRALLAAVNTQKDIFNSVEVIKSLQNNSDVKEEDIFKIEWAYLPALNKYNNTLPIFLEKRLASDPNFLCQVIQLIYRSRNNSSVPNELSEEKQKIATNAFRLINDWNLCPGQQPDGSFHEISFEDWLKSVKEKCEASGHMEVALTHVGQVLINSPKDEKGLWINRTIAQALNNPGVNDMRNGFSIALFNSRGASFVDPTGKPEHDLAKSYRQKAEETENAGFQRLAATLRNLASSYDREAGRNIIEDVLEKQL